MDIVYMLACKIYLLIEEFWKPRVERKDQIMVQIIDLYAHSCFYCTNWRSIILGLGFGLLISGHLFAAAAAIGAIVLLVVVERIACKIPKRGEPDG